MLLLPGSQQGEDLRNLPDVCREHIALTERWKLDSYSHVAEGHYQNAAAPAPHGVEKNPLMALVRDGKSVSRVATRLHILGAENRNAPQQPHCDVSPPPLAVLVFRLVEGLVCIRIHVRCVASHGILRWDST